MTRSALVLLGPSTGGIRRHVLELARQLPAWGWSPVLAGPPGVLGGARALEVALEVPGADPLRLARSARALRGAARGVDLVHAHGLKAGWLAVLARLEAPVVVTIHNLVLDEAAGAAAPALRLIEGALPGRVAATIAVSSGIAARFAGRAGAERMSVVRPAGPPPAPTRSAAEVRAALGVAQQRPLVVAVARLHPQKDLHTLIAAAETLCARRPAAAVAIVGEGPLREALEREIARRGLAGDVLLAGPSAEASDELAAADVVVVPSRWESGPLAAAEALLLGRPLVSTPVGFVPELVEDGASGRIVPVGDPAALAEAVNDLLDDPAGAAAMGARGRRRAEALLDPRALVGEVAGVYDRAVRGWAAA